MNLTLEKDDQVTQKMIDVNVKLTQQIKDIMIMQSHIDELIVKREFSVVVRDKRKYVDPLKLKYKNCTNFAEFGIKDEFNTKEWCQDCIVNSKCSKHPLMRLPCLFPEDFDSMMRY